MTDIDKSYRYWRKRVFITIWITYSSFYLGRVNISIAIPGIMSEFGISKTEMGAVVSALFVTYAAGQFINGQLGDKFGGRRFVTAGLLLTALMNLFFGFSNGISVMIVIWALNGYFQSMGWAPTVKTLANWFPPKTRGKMSGLLGSSYQIGNAYSWALAGFVTGLLGWRWAFWIPAIFLFISAIHFFIRSRNAPEEVGLPTIEEEVKGKSESSIKKDTHLGFRYTLRIVLQNPSIWVVSIAFSLLSVVRYGFMDWAPTYMFEVQNAEISKAAFKAIALPLAGSIGAVSAGWVSDRYFQSRRAPVISIGLVFLGIFSWLFPRIPAENWILSLIALLGVGFFTYGPHVLMVATMPMDLGTRKASSSVTGFIDGFGYIGAAFTGVGSGWLIDHYSWNAAFNFWISGAFIAAFLMVLLWNVKPTYAAKTDEEYPWA